MAVHKELAKAVAGGDVAAATALLEGGADLRGATDVWGWPLLNVAALRGRTEMIRLLWEKDPAREPASLRRALYFSFQSGKADAVEYLLGLGAATSAAEAALYRRDLEGLKAALAADPPALEAPDPEGNRPLHVAANLRLAEAARFLLDAGAEVDPRNGKGETPFFRSISNNAPAVAELLLARGADVNTVTDYGQNALHCAATGGKDGLVELLEKHGIAPAFRDVHVAARMGNMELLTSLIESDPVRVHARDPFGATPLYWAAAFDRLEAAGFLLARGADPNVRELNGRTPMLCATECGKRAMIELLVRHGASAEP